MAAKAPATAPSRRWFCGFCADGNCGQCRGSLRDARPAGKDGDRTVPCACREDGHLRERKPAMTTVLAAELVTVTANLDEHIQRRAEELAAPLVAEAERKANEAVRDARMAVQRQEDIVAELRRRIAVMERQREAANA